MKSKSSTFHGFSLANGFTKGFANCLTVALSTALSTLAFSPAHAGSDVNPIKTLSGLHLNLIDGSVLANCTMNTPERCQSRKDIHISPSTSSFMKQTLKQMIPGHQRWAKNQAEIKAINEENDRLKGAGEELKIAKNIERLVDLQSEDHSVYHALYFTPFLWAPHVIKFGTSRFAEQYSDDLGHYSQGSITMNHVLNHRLAKGDNRYLNLDDASYSISRDLSFSYNPNMEMSFVVRIQSYVGYPNQSPSLYATEDLVARCEERRIYNTVFKIKTSLSERHLVCTLPENLGSLRFKVVE